MCAGREWGQPANRSDFHSSVTVKARHQLGSPSPPNRLVLLLIDTGQRAVLKFRQTFFLPPASGGEKKILPVSLTLPLLRSATSPQI